MTGLTRTTIWTPTADVERADRLAATIKPTDGLTMDRSKVLRMAIRIGLQVLEESEAQRRTT